jgi:hypothetical protein
MINKTILYTITMSVIKIHTITMSVIKIHTITMSVIKIHTMFYIFSSGFTFTATE